MCYKCGAIVHCGNDCCRHKSSGPYYRHEQEGDMCYEICEVCGFKLDANVSMDLNYYGCILDGSWFQGTIQSEYSDEQKQSMIDSATVRYAELMAKYVHTPDSGSDGPYYS